MNCERRDGDDEQGRERLQDEREAHCRAWRRQRQRREVVRWPNVVLYVSKLKRCEWCCRPAYSSDVPALRLCKIGPEKLSIETNKPAKNTGTRGIRTPLSIWLIVAFLARNESIEDLIVVRFRIILHLFVRQIHEAWARRTRTWATKGPWYTSQSSM